MDACIHSLNKITTFSSLSCAPSVTQCYLMFLQSRQLQRSITLANKLPPNAELRELSVCWTKSAKKNERWIWIKCICKVVLTLKLNVLQTNTDVDSDACLAGSSCPGHPPREAGERSGIPQAYVLRDITAHRGAGWRSPQHTLSHSIATTEYQHFSLWGFFFFFLTYLLHIWQRLQTNI